MLKRIHKHHRFMWGYSRTLFKSLARPAFVFLSFLSATTMLLVSGLLYFLDPQPHFGVSSFLDVLYFVVTTMSGVGYGDVVPLTAFGKLVAMMLMLLGTAIFVSFTATLATVIMELEFEINDFDNDEDPKPHHPRKRK